MTEEQFIAALSETGIPFRRDIWIDERNELAGDYGVVELTGSPSALWGDNRLVAQTMRGNVILYVDGTNDHNSSIVQAALAGTGAYFELAAVEYIRETNQTRWTWRFVLEEWFEEPEPEPDEGGDEDGEADNGGL